MSTAAPPAPGERREGDDPYRLGRDAGDSGGGGGGREASGRGQGGPSSKRITVAYGFWIFLLSDIVMFSAFFAAFAVLRDATAGGPTAPQLFDLTRVGWETALLLASSFTCGLGALATERRSTRWTEAALLATGLLGFAFLVLELQEFGEMIAHGAGPQRSAFLSAFFALVGCHGLHVGVGLLWLGTMMAQLWVKGFRPAILPRLMCFNLFWHALDIIWVGLFTIVYLLGVRG